MEKTNPKFDPTTYFMTASNPLHKQYLALRKYFVDGLTAEQVALETGYATATIYSLIRDFKQKLDFGYDPFFKEPKLGRPKLDHGGEINRLVVAYRKQYLSVPEIKAVLDAQNICVSETYIYALLVDEGFAKLPRRENVVRNDIGLSGKIEGCSALKSERIRYDPDPEAKPEKFSSQLAGILLFLPIIKRYGIDKLIIDSDYPETSVITRLSSILSFLALKLSDIERYSMDDAWCMDRGMGLFAGLNVLPKTAWFSSYSSSVTREMNLSFLKSLRILWNDNGLLSNTVNLDFTTIPYWGEDDPFENNWSGKRTKALASLLAVLAQDPDSGLLCYSDTTIRHKNESDVILEFLDFYHNDPKVSSNLKYLVFDSRFTTYQNLNKLDKQGLKFITIQRKSKKIEEKIAGIPDESWKKIRVARANGKGRTVTAYEDTTDLSDYDGKVRQVFIRATGKIKAAIIITNDFNISLEDIVRKYAKRWLVMRLAG